MNIYDNKMVHPLECFMHESAFTISDEQEDEVEIILENSVAQPNPEGISMIYAKL